MSSSYLRECLFPYEFQDSLLDPFMIRKSASLCVMRFMAVASKGQGGYCSPDFSFVPPDGFRPDYGRSLAMRQFPVKITIMLGSLTRQIWHRTFSKLPSYQRIFLH